MYTLNWGTVSWEAESVRMETFNQPLNRIGTQSEISRSQRAGVQQYNIADLSGGLLPDDQNDIRDINVLNRYTYNEGNVTRIPGALLLPEVVTNQASITSDIDISGAVAANKRAHGVSTAIGSTVGEQVYYGLDTMFLLANTSTGALEVKSCNVDAAGNNTVLPGQVTAAGILYVSGSPQLALALKDYGIVGTTDPDAANPVFTEIVDGASDSYVTAIRYLPTIGPGVNIAVSNVDGTNGVWWWDGADAAGATVKPVVLEATKTEPNASATEQTLTGSAITAGMVFTNTSPAGTNTWSSLVNAVGSDNTDATCSITSGEESDFIGITLAEFGWTTDDLPDAATITDLQMTVEVAERNAADNIYFWRLGFWTDPDDANGSTAPTTSTFLGPIAVGDGENGPFGSTPGEISDSDTSYTVGIGQSALQQITAAQIRKGALAVSFTDDNGTTPEIDMDDISAVLVKYKLPGDQVSLPLGGWGVRANPATPNTIQVVTPTSDQETAITIPRELWDLTFTYDSARQRPTVTISQPNEGMTNVHHAIPFLGGTLLAGGLQTGSGNILNHISSSGSLFSYRFPSEYDGKVTKIIWMIPHGIWAIMGVALENSGTIDDYQVWFFNGKNLRLYTDTPLLSLTDDGGSNMTIEAEPIAFSQAFVSPNLNYIYTIMPKEVSMTQETAVRRERVHNDLALDPRADNPAWVKQMAFSSGSENTSLWTRLPRIGFGPVEADKTLVEMQATTDQLDDDTTYGDVTWEIDTGGDTGFSSAEASNLFDSSLENYQIPSAGIHYNDMILRAGLMHQAGSAETPNGLGIVLTTKQQWPRLQRYIVRTRRSLLNKHQGSLPAFLADIDTLQTAKNVQALNVSVDGTESSLVGQVPASFEGIRVEGEPTGELDIAGDDPFELVFQKIPGKVATS